MTKPRYWKPLQKLSANDLVRDERVTEAAMAHYGISREEAIRRQEAHDGNCTYYVNDRYQVEVEGSAPLDDPDAVSLVHINIRRRDGGAVHDWRDLQQIKNEILGPECEAIEIYPAESRLVDTSNKYHLWGVRDPTFRFPVSLHVDNQRDVKDGDMKASTAPGLRQRPL